MLLYRHTADRALTVLVSVLTLDDFAEANREQLPASLDEGLEGADVEAHVLRQEVVVTVDVIGGYPVSERFVLL